jgi:hypothetical protein
MFLFFNVLLGAGYADCGYGQGRMGIKWGSKFLVGSSNSKRRRRDGDGDGEWMVGGWVGYNVDMRQDIYVVMDI